MKKRMMTVIAVLLTGSLFASEVPDIKKAFFRDFQLTGFFDIGTAWRGLSPFSEANPSNIRIIEVPPVIKIKLRYYADPLIAGYVFDTVGSYQPVFACLAGLAVAGLVLVQFLQSNSPAEIEVT